MSEIKPSEYLIPVQAELLPDGNIRIPETVLRGSQCVQHLTLEVCEEFDRGYLDSSLHLDDWCTNNTHLYLVAANMAPLDTLIESDADFI